ncbi:MAG: ABC transporter permease subunit [Planctomycetota bacterium]
MTETGSTPARRRTTASVHLWDRTAELVITAGGLTVLGAVLAICVYLFYEVAPLFSQGEIEETGRGAVVTDSAASAPAEGLITDEFGEAAFWMRPSGAVVTLLIGNEPGRVLTTLPLAANGKSVTVWSMRPGGQEIALGFDDGTVTYGAIGFDWRVVSPDQLPEAARSLEVGQIMTLADAGDDRSPGWVSRPREDLFRVSEPELELRRPFRVGRSESPVVALDYQVNAAGRRVLAVAREDRTGAFAQIRESRPLGGGAPRVRTTVWDLDLGGVTPDSLFVSADGADVLALDGDGAVRRFGTGGVARDEAIPVVEQRSLLREGEELTSMGWLLGAQTLLVAGSDGGGGAWFVAPERAGGTDGRALVRAHPLPVGDGAYVAFGPAASDRLVAGLTDAGALLVWHQTSDKLIASTQTGASDPALVALSPRGDLVLGASSDGGFSLFGLEAGHTEASFKSVFAKVHYENTPAPAWVYQSSAGSDAAEPKLSLTPLIWGTLKATLFAMLFAVPVAVLAALYSSEFMSPELHKVVKPALELMASLPSVVLGFVAAFVVAPIAAEHLSELIAGAFVLPVVAVIGATAWQAIPGRITRRVGSGFRLVIIGIAMAVGIAASLVIGPIGEAVLFTPTREAALVGAGSVEPVADASGLPAFTQDGVAEEERLRLAPLGLTEIDGLFYRAVEPTGEAAAEVESAIEAGGLAEPSMRRWLDGAFGSATPGWFLLLLAPTAVLAVIMAKRYASRMAGDSLVADALLTLGAAIGGAGVAFAGAWVLTSMGLDPRLSIIGPFDQRNTLVVAIIMGFAVIPIIYTISDDAMRSVPESLRSASLGAGATPWQTAVRVVLPVAGSGVFSACMIGLGRAVGETMIVLMATGNTPEMELNIFSGFRTLAANIAVELPEAPKGGTHYRILFLCGLVLFTMTFVINTTAEAVRQRFRKRSAAL